MIFEQNTLVKTPVVDKQNLKPGAMTLYTIKKESLATMSTMLNNTGGRENGIGVIYLHILDTIQPILFILSTWYAMHSPYTIYSDARLSIPI